MSRTGEQELDCFFLTVAFVTKYKTTLYWRVESEQIMGFLLRDWKERRKRKEKASPASLQLWLKNDQLTTPNLPSNPNQKKEIMHIISSLQKIRWKYRTPAWKTHPLPHGLRGSPHPTGAYEAYLPHVCAMRTSPRSPTVSKEKFT